MSGEQPSDAAPRKGAARIDSLDWATLAWDKQGGLLPAIVQDAETGRVLMLAYMDRAAFDTTVHTGRVTFFSRSRQRAWTKGETSGHWLDVVSIAADCDADALLVRARPQGPTCHRGTVSCFDGAEVLPADSASHGDPSPIAGSRSSDPGCDAAAHARSPQIASHDVAASLPTVARVGIDADGAGTGRVVAALDALLAKRAVERPEGSYTTRLFESGVRRIAQKVGEEGVETALAAVAQDEAALTSEAADLLYHLLVLLHARGLSLADVEEVLQLRAQRAGDTSPR